MVDERDTLKGCGKVVLKEHEAVEVLDDFAVALLAA